MRQLRWLPLFCVTILSAEIVCAQTPVVASESLWSYGPAHVCISEYALTVAADEAVQVSTYASGQKSYRLHSDSLFGLDIRAGIAIDPELMATATNRRITGPHQIEYVRYNFPAQSGFRDGIPGEAVYFSDPAYRQYHLPNSDGSPAIVVGSPDFAQPNARRDRAILARMVPRRIAECATLRPAAVAGVMVRGGQVFHRDPVVGPARICSSGLALDLVAGERAFAQFKFQRDAPKLWTIERQQGFYSLMPMHFAAYPEYPQGGQLRDLGFETQVYPGDETFIALNGPRFLPTGRPTASIIHSRLDGAAIDDIIDRLAVAPKDDTACWAA